jgi:hypothetical protein
MKSKLTRALALFSLAALLLTVTSCKKELTNTSVNQNLQASTPASKAQSFTTSEKVPFDFSIFVPCANGGTGEDVVLSGYLHVVSSFIINGNNVSGKSHFQPQGISGVGTITGDKYQATGVTQDQFKGSLVNGQFQETTINNFLIIGQGKGNNFTLHENSHITINANGSLTTIIDNYKSDCK